MKLKFLPFIFGISLTSIGVNAETFENIEAEEANFEYVKVNESLNVSGDASIKTLFMKIPRGENTNYFLNCENMNISSGYRSMFNVSANGLIRGTGLTIQDQAANHCCAAQIHIGYSTNSKAMEISTYSYPGQYYDMSFKAKKFVFEEGDMVVNGKISCKDELNVTALNAENIKVKMDNAADYVFDESYNLKSLSEVESYVNENKHLPGIPSAAEMAKNGMSVSEMSNMLLEKVEELTLHMIRLEKENSGLRGEVKSLRDELNKLK